MTPEEKAAEKWVAREHGLIKYADNLLRLPAAYNHDDVVHLQLCKKAFLAGHAHALAPRKIDEQEPEPYKRVMLFDGKEWWYGHFDCACDLYVYYYEDGTRHDKIFTYWFPLPPTPQCEGE